MLARICLIIAVIAAAVFSTSSADSWSVVLDGSGDFTAIQPAVDAAAAGDTIVVFPGRFTGDGNRDIDPAGKSLVIRSLENSPLSTTIDCEGSANDPHRGFWFHTGEDSLMRVEGISITGGGGVPWGGGIMIGDPAEGEDSLGAEPRIDNCVVISCEAGRGGGMASYGIAYPVVTNTWFSGNEGDGVHFWADGWNDDLTARFEDCQFNDNTGDGFYADATYISYYDVDPVTIIRCGIAGNGGDGIQIGDPGTMGWLNLFDSEITGNDGWGLVVRCSDVSDAVVSGCLIQENSLGGIYLGTENFRLSDSEVSFNSGPGIEGWVAFEYEVNHCLVVHNLGFGIEGDSSSYTRILSTTVADNQGYGVFLKASELVTFTNNIVAGNAGAGIVYPEDQWYPPDVQCNDVHGNSGGDWNEMLEYLGINGNFSADPTFCVDTDEPYSIHALSPCAPENHPDGADCGLIGAFGVDCGGPAAAPAAQSTLLLGNYPNPFNPTTTIAFTLAGDVTASLQVYDLTGRLVRTLVADERLPRGPHSVRWQGRDDRGYPVASGLYLYRLEAGDVTEIRRMALIK